MDQERKRSRRDGSRRAAGVVWRGGGSNLPRRRRWLELGDDGLGGPGGPAKAEWARCVDGPAQKKYFNRLGCQGETGQNTVWAEQRMKLFLQFPFQPI
jgi:hypothetical protein